MNEAFALATSLLGRSDVSGVFRSSLRWKAGTWTAESCITVGVRKKRPLSELSPEEIIPAEIRGVKTDVIELNPKLSLYTPRYSVMCGGTSIGDSEGARAGTLGGIFYDRVNDVICGMTNFHVMASGDTPQVPSAYAIHPAVDDGGDVSWRVGKSSRYIIDEWGDAAIFTLYKNPSLSMLTSHQILRGIAEPQIDDLVEKVGRTTGVTQGKVSAVGYLTLDYTEQGYGSILMNVFSYVPREDPNEVIADGGDSGSIVYNTTTGNGVGLHVAHQTDPMTAYACILSYVLEDLNCDGILTSIRETQGIGTVNQSTRYEYSQVGTCSYSPADTSLTTKIFAVQDSETTYADFETWVQAQGYDTTQDFLDYMEVDTAEDFVTSIHIDGDTCYETVEEFLADQKIKSLKDTMADLGVTF